MPKTQAQILDLMSRLSPEERIEVMDQIHASNLLPELFYDRMTSEQRAHLAEGIDQADRGQGDDAPVVFDRLSKRLGLESA